MKSNSTFNRPVVSSPAPGAAVSSAPAQSAAAAVQQGGELTWGDSLYGVTSFVLLDTSQHTPMAPHL